jgi:hypothetical protein
MATLLQNIFKLLSSLSRLNQLPRQIKRLGTGLGNCELSPAWIPFPANKTSKWTWLQHRCGIKHLQTPEDPLPPKQTRHTRQATVIYAPTCQVQAPWAFSAACMCNLGVYMQVRSLPDMYVCVYMYACMYMPMKYLQPVGVAFKVFPQLRYQSAKRPTFAKSHD